MSMASSCGPPGSEDGSVENFRKPTIIQDHMFLGTPHLPRKYEACKDWRHGIS